MRKEICTNSLSLVKLTEASGIQATARGVLTFSTQHQWDVLPSLVRGQQAEVGWHIPARWFGRCVLDEPGALWATISSLFSSIPFLLRLPGRVVFSWEPWMRQHSLFCAPKALPKSPFMLWVCLSVLVFVSPISSRPVDLLYKDISALIVTPSKVNID